jgi:hypothetical protein
MRISVIIWLLLLAASASGQTQSPDGSSEPTKRSTCTISGFIVDADTGDPVFGAQCEARDEKDFLAQPSKSWLTDSTGAFRITGLELGTYYLSASRGQKGYSDGASASVVDGDLEGITVKYHKGGSISGQVVIESNDPLIRDQIGTLRISGIPGGEDLLAADGAFNIAGVPPGAVTLSVFGGGGKFFVDRVERDGIAIGYGDGSIVSALARAHDENLSGLVVFVVYHDGVINGQMKVVGGTLPAQAAVKVLVDTPNVDDRKLFELALNGLVGEHLDPEGRFVIEGLSPGKHLVTLVVERLSASTRPVLLCGEVIVADGSQSEITLVLDLTTNQDPVEH